MDDVPTVPVDYPHTQQWTDSMEHNIVRIGEKSLGYKVMHMRSARRSAALHSGLMYLAIIFGPISGLLSGIGVMVHPEAHLVFPLVSTCVAFISGVLVAVVKFAKWEEDYIAHKQSAALYTSLESNVRRQLAIPRDGRCHAMQYIEWVGKSFDDLFTKSPMISSRIFRAYAASATVAGVAVPDEYTLSIRIDDCHVPVQHTYDVAKMEYEMSRMLAFQT
jgi:hypothetical protein